MNLASRRPPRFSFKVWPRDIPWPELRDVWLAADAEGSYQGGWLFDHFYPPRPGQRAAVFEAWTLLAGLATVTRRLRLGVMVSSNTFRHPALLAKMAITVDHLSGGRADIGIGAGWHEEEHRAFGLDFPRAADRWERLGETCAILDGLMTRKSFSFDGEHYRLQEAEAGLAPIQRPRPPIVIGGIGPRRTLPLVARWADHWNYYERPISREGFQAAYQRLLDLCAEIGRDPEEIEVSVQMLFPGAPDQARDLAAEYLEAGAHQILMSFPTPVDPGAVAATGRALASLR